jgi:hypothetical protein
LYSWSRVTGWAGGGMIISGARRPAGVLVRPAPGRELPRRLAAGRVLALAAVRGLAGALDLPAPFLPPFLTALFRAVVPCAVPGFGIAAPALARPAFAAPGLVLALAVLALVPDLAVPDLAVLDLAVLDLAVALGMLAFGWLALTDVPDFARDLLAAGLLALAAVTRAGDLAVTDLPAGDLAPDGLAADDLRADGRAAVAVFAVARLAAGRLAAGRRAGAAAGLAADIELAAVLRAFAAVVIALVALFTDCMAVDSVRADDVALVAAAVILVAAEVTLVAADDTVRAAVAGVELADEARRVGRAVVRAPLVVRAVLRGLAVRADFVAVVRAGDLPPAGRAAAVVLGRPAERCEALELTDRVLPERAGLRPAFARAVVCTGTDFPPS